MIAREGLMTFPLADPPVRVLAALGRWWHRMAGMGAELTGVAGDG
jgi:hypothetical protein